MSDLNVVVCVWKVMSKRIVKSSRIYFWDELGEMESVNIVENPVEEPYEEFFEASNIRNTRLKTYRKYISHFQNIRKKVSDFKLSKAAEKIKKRLERLQDHK